MKLLLVEDERDLNQSLTKLLKKNQFSVDSAFDGQEALDYLAVGDYDVIILDVMMPRMDGFQFIQRLRRDNHKVAVLMLTARDALEDRIKGLDLGADDYVTKPYNMKELLLRIKAILSRTSPQNKSTLSYRDLSLDLEAHTLHVNAKPIELTKLEFEIGRAHV